MRKLLIICAACLQIILLAFIGGQREYVLRTGRTIYLRTVPFDPRDSFRGDYARLSYEISSIDKKYFKGNLEQKLKNKSGRSIRGISVYTVLKIDSGNLASIDYVTDKKPAKGVLFIRGRTDYSYSDSFINVSYGIEAYFVEQGKGRQLETRMFDKERTSLEMEVALGDNGIAVLKGYRRSPLAIKAENLERKDGFLQTCKLVLTNISDKPLAIVDLPDYGCLNLEIGATFIHKKLVWSKKDAGNKPQDKDVHILEPNENYVFNIDFNDPHWLVMESDKGTKNLSLKDIGKFAPLFSLVYEPPTAEQCSDLKDANLIWHGKLSSGSLENFEEEMPSILRRHRN